MKIFLQKKKSNEIRLFFLISLFFTLQTLIFAKNDITITTTEAAIVVCTDSLSYSDNCYLEDSYEEVLDVTECSTTKRSSSSILLMECGKTEAWTALQSGVLESPVTPNFKVKITLSDYSTYWDGAGGAFTKNFDDDCQASDFVTNYGPLPDENSLKITVGHQNNNPSGPAILTVEYLDMSNNSVNVTNPRMHFARLGGVVGGNRDGSEWTLQNGVTATLLSSFGDVALTNSGTTLETINLNSSVGNSATCSSDTGAGTLELNGTFSTFSFSVVDWTTSGIVNYSGTGDGIDLIFEGCTVPIVACTDPNLYAATCDLDGDGVLNEDDLDDDNDGILDMDENNCVAPVNGARPDIWWDINSNALPGDVEENVATSYLASTNPVAFGAGINVANSATIWEITGINGATLADAMTNNDYFEFGFTTAANGALLTLEEWSSFANSSAFQAGAVTLSNVSILLSDDNFATSKTVFTGTAPTSGNWTTQSTSDCIFALNTSYTIRVYLYNQATEPAYLDAFGVYFSCLSDTDNDGTPNQFDLDSDNDGCSDAFEAGTTTSEAANFQFANTGTGANGFEDTIETNDTASATYDNNGTTTYTYNQAIDGTSACTPPCTDPNLYAATCDLDGDGVLNEDDLDDDNDGILDTDENNCVAPVNGARPDIWWDINSNALPGDVEENVATSYLASTNPVAFGAGINVANSATIWEITGINGATLADAMTNNDYMEFGFTTTANGALLTLEEWSSFANSSAFQAGAVTLSNVSILLSDDNFATSKTVFTGTAPTSGNWTTQSTSDCIFAPNTSYTIRVYLYNQATEPAYLDAFGVYFSCLSDTDNDGTPNQFDLDSDNDGCSDAFEAGTTTSEAANFQFANTGTGANGFEDTIETNDTASATYDNGGTTTYTYNQAIDGTSACTPPCTDPNLYAATCDLDGDGVLNEDDLDDDNDGILDTDENNCVAPVNGARPDIWWDINSNALPGDVEENVATSYLASTNPVAFGAGINVANSATIWEITGINGATLADAMTNNDYMEFGFTTAANGALLTLEEWSSFANSSAFQAGAVTLSNVSILLSDDNFATSKMVFTGTAPSSGNWTTQSTSDCIFAPNTSYMIRVYLYNQATEPAYLDAFGVYFYCLSDTDNDGIANQFDLDSDNDGCSDAFEAGTTTSQAANFQFANTGTGANGFEDTIETNDTASATYDNGGTTTYTYNQAIDGTSACTPPCTDPNLYAATCDLDGDGVLNEDDLDDDNDGVLDTDENNCVAPVNGARPDIWWDINSNALPGDIEENVATSYLSSTNSVAFGAGINVANSATIWEITGINGATLADAITNNDYMEFGFTTAANGALLTLEEWSTFANSSAFQAGAVTLSNVSILLSDDNFATSKTVFTGTAPSSGNWTTQSTSDCIFAPNTSYTIRVYLYNQATEPAYLDAFGVYFYCLSDTDNDGIPNQFDLDSDNDGCSDAFEAGTTTSQASNFQFANTGTGANGFENTIETNDTGSATYDNGGTTTYTYSQAIDGTSACSSCLPIASSSLLDTDGDGLTDCEETTGMDNPNTVTVPTGITDPNDPCDPIATSSLTDTDGDGLTDCEEITGTNNPNTPLTPTGITDPNDICDPIATSPLTDTDGDGLTDCEEITGTNNPNTPLTPTGITDPTDPCDPIATSSLTDTDGDGLTDCEEITGTNNPNTPLTPTGITDPNDPCDPIATSSLTDTDGDGLTDCEEITGTDNPNTPLTPTGITDPNDPCDPIATSSLMDTDGDGLTDCEEISGVDNPNTLLSPPNDIDGLTSDPNDPCDPISLSALTDSDGDGLSDCEEITGLDNPNTTLSPPNDADGLTSDPNDPCDPIEYSSLLDTDGDGLTDCEEITGTNNPNTPLTPTGITDPNNICDPIATSPLTDTDGDGLTDCEEITGTNNPNTPLTPTGITDPNDICDPIATSPLTDTDGDGLTDCEEITGTNNPNTPLTPTGITDPNDPCDPIATSSLTDTDGDGLTDCEEITGTDNPNTPLVPTTTSDPTDPCDPIATSSLTDTDGDGLTDCEEITGTDNPNTPLVPTTTSDPTDPCDPIATSSLTDTDGDGLTDCEEISGVDNPNTPLSPPNDIDGLTSDPNDPCDPISLSALTDSDGDGLSDCEEITGLDNPNTTLAPPNDADGLTSDPNDPCDPILYSSLLDSDGDGLTDCEEITGMDNPNTPLVPTGVTDPNDICDPIATSPLTDTDGDGLTDCEEITGTDNPNTPLVPTGITDPNDICDPIATSPLTDTDGDGLTDCEEITGTDNPNTPLVPTGITDPNDICDPIATSPLTDTDGDGLTDCEEITGTDNPNTPLVPTGITDPNDICDPIATSPLTDTDGDGLTDCEEITGTDNPNTPLVPTMISDPNDPCDPIATSSLTDTDGDGLTDCEEITGTDNPNTPVIAVTISDPNDPCDPIATSSLTDTDGDGLTDCEEITGTDNPFTPLVPTTTSDPNDFCDPLSTPPTVGVSTDMPIICLADDLSLLTANISLGAICDPTFIGDKYTWNWSLTSIDGTMIAPVVISPTFTSNSDVNDHLYTTNAEAMLLAAGVPLISGIYSFTITVTDCQGCQHESVTTIDVGINLNPTADPITTNSIYCASNKSTGVSPVKGTNYSSSTLSVDCSAVCAGLVAPGGVTLPTPVSNWYDATGNQVFDLDTDWDGVMDAYNNSGSFDPVAAGLVDANVPGDYTYYVDCSCAPSTNCASARVPATLTILDCGIDEGCTYLLVLEDTGANGWDGASIDVSINSGISENYKVTQANCDVLIVPISANDGGTIDLTYWNGANEAEHSWTLLDPLGNIAMDQNNVPATYGPTPPANQTVRVKLDCPENCEEEAAYQIVLTLGATPMDMSYELHDGLNDIIVLRPAGVYANLAPGTTIIDTTLTLSSCEDYLFKAYDGTGNGWAGGSWSIQGTDQDRGTVVLDSEGNAAGYYEIARSTVSFDFEKVNNFTIPCKPTDCPADMTVSTNSATCEATGFIHPTVPTPFVCYPNCGHAIPGPSVTVSYPSIGVGQVAVGTAVDLPVGANPVVYTITYADGSIVRCNSIVNVVTSINTSMTCNDNVIIALPAPFTGVGECTVVVMPDDVLEAVLDCEGQYVVTVFDTDGISLGNTVGPNQAGQTLQYQIQHLGSENICWGTLSVEDKHAPIIECQDYVIACNHPAAMDENYNHTETYQHSYGDLPANMAGNLGSDATATIEVECGPLGEIVKEISFTVDHAHSRPSDLEATITAPNGLSITTELPANQELMNLFLGEQFTAYVGTWQIEIVDNDGTMVDGDVGKGAINGVELSITAGFPRLRSVVDCTYNDDLVLLNEVLVETDCDQSEWLGAKIIRTWQAIDVFGNSATCTQEIGLRAPTTTDLGSFSSVNIECGTEQLDVNGSIDIAQSGGPAFDCFDIEATHHGLCDVSLTYEDTTIPSCGNGYKVIRTWTILNWCSGVTIQQEQTIKVEDTTGPSINIDDIVVGTASTNCTTGSIQLSPALTDNCSGIQSVTATYTEGGGTYNANGTLVIVDITNGETIDNLSFGITQIAINAKDNCGNETNEVINVNVADNTAPIAICDDELHVSLGSDGTALLSADDVDEGSYDNCSEVTLAVRRTDGCLGSTDWSDTVAFECCDVDELITVELRVTDAAGNSNVCWKQVLIEDALAPVITCAPDKTLDCDSPEVHAPFGEPSFLDNCSAEIISTVDGGELDQCKAGTLTRTWTVSDGSDKSADVSCTQRVTVNHISDFIVQFPADVTLTDCAIQDTGEPTLTDDDCELIAINSDDVILTIVDDACYKIERTWTVINWCVYDQGNAANTDLGLPQPLPRTYQDDDGYFQYTQVIKVLDGDAPTITCPNDQIFDDLTDGCEGQADLTIEAEDACSGTAALEYTYKIDAFNDGSFDIVATGNDASGVYPYGTHLIKWIVEDGCGNTSICSYLFTIRDAKNPTPVCLNGISAPGMNSDGCVEIWANDLLEYAFDNCSDATFVENTVRIRRAGATSAPTGALTLCCADGLGPQLIEVWVEDEAGNADYCTTYVDLQDPNGICDGGNPDDSRMIAGTIATEGAEMVETVMVDIDGSNGMSNAMPTGNNGQYMFDNLTQQMDYTIRPEKDTYPLNGVSTYDLVLMSQHILGIDPLTSPYQLIAADVNSDGNVTTFDIVQNRQMILYVIQDYPTNTSWRFVDADYVFPVTTNPWFEAFPESIDVANLSQDEMLMDFVAIKIGDVNGDAIPNSIVEAEERNLTGTLVLSVEDTKLSAGNTSSIDFRASDFEDINGYQFTMNFDATAMNFTGVKAGALNVSEANFGLSMLNEGVITTSWNNAAATKVANDEVLFTLDFMVTAEVQLSEVLSINSRYTRVEAYADTNLMDVNLVFNSAEGTVVNEGIFELYQNTPNPFNGETIIGFTLPKASTTSLKILDATGKVLKLITGDFASGYNQVSLNKTDLDATGVLYYQLDSSTYTATKKMIILK